MSAEPVPHAAVEPAAFACLNCQATSVGEYCSRCGQKRIHDGDLSLAHAWHHVLHDALHLDGRLFATLKVLLTRPGQLTLDFVAGRRARHLGPLGLFLSLGTLYFMFASNWLGATLDLSYFMKQIKDPQVKVFIEQKAAAAGMTVEAYLHSRNESFHKVYKAAHMTAVLLGGVWLSLLFRTPRRYLAEHMVFVLHTGSFGFLLSLAGSWAAGWRGHTLVLLVIGLAYFVLAARRVYGGAWALLAAKGVLLQFLEMAVVVLGMAAAFVKAAVF